MNTDSHGNELMVPRTPAGKPPSVPVRRLVAQGERLLRRIERAIRRLRRRLEA